MKKPATPEPHHHASDPGWIERNPGWIERNVNAIIIALIVACVLSVLATFWPGLDHEHHHPHFEQEGWLGFQAAFGFHHVRRDCLSRSWTTINRPTQGGLL